MTVRGLEFFVVSFFLAPLLSIIFAECFGELMESIEGWNQFQGFWYHAVNIAGLPNPFVNVSPVTTAGKLADCVVSILSLLFSSTIVGVCGMLTVISDLPDKFRLDNGRRAAVAVFGVTPLIILLTCVGFGALLAVFEGKTTKY